jgi:hypothetical protein
MIRLLSDRLREMDRPAQPTAAPAAQATPTPAPAPSPGAARDTRAAQAKYRLMQGMDELIGQWRQAALTCRAAASTVARNNPEQAAYYRGLADSQLSALRDLYRLEYKGRPKYEHCESCYAPKPEHESRLDWPCRACGKGVDKP